MRKGVPFMQVSVPYMYTLLTYDTYVSLHSTQHDSCNSSRAVSDLVTRCYTQQQEKHFGYIIGGSAGSAAQCVFCKLLQLVTASLDLSAMRYLVEM
jgi:hypothetical protein